MALRTHPTRIALALVAALIPLSSLAQGASGPAAARAFIAAPDVYKIVAEGQQHRVLAVTLRPGQRSAEHHHPAQTAVFFINDCILKLTEGGSDMNAGMSAGTAIFMGLPTTHAAQNVGTTDCKMVYFEPK